MTEQVQVRAHVPERAVDVKLSWPVGETLALVGPNGSGKSTTVDVLAGAITGSDCTVRIGQRDLTTLPAHKRRLGYLEQRALLFPHLTAVRNVEFGLKAQGRKQRVQGRKQGDQSRKQRVQGRKQRDRHRDRALQELAAVDCEDYASRRPHQLSGGQAQRVALARALATDPELVLLDEPLAALDASLAPQLRRLLTERLTGTTTLLVTHDLLDVLALADQVAVLDSGRVTAQLPVAELIARPPTAFAAEFAGTNLLVGTELGERVSVPPEAITLEPADSSAPGRTRFPVKLESLDRVGRIVRARVLLDEQELRAELTPQQLLDLNLTPGDRLAAVIDPERVIPH